MAVVVDGVDWSDGEISHSVRAACVDPVDHGAVRGWLPLERAAGTITEDSTSDTRASADLRVADWSAYVPLSWVRVIHDVETPGGRTLSAPMITGVVWEEGAKVSPTGLVTASPQVVSALKALDGDVLTGPLSVGDGAGMLDCMRDLTGRLATPGRALDVAWGSRDARMSGTRTWDPGTSVLSVLSDMAQVAGDRVRVTPEGAPGVEADDLPAARPVRCELDCADASGVVLSAAMSVSSDAHSRAGRHVVARRASEGEGDARHDVWESRWADASPGDQANPWARGYTVADFDSVSSVDQGGPADLQAEAASRLAAAGSDVEWELTTMYVPLHEHDVVGLTPPGMARRLCEVRNVSVDLGTWRCTLTLREAL